MPSHSQANAMMVNTKELSIDFRQKIIDLLKASNSYGEFSKHLNIPRSTVQSVIKKFFQFGYAETLPGLAENKSCQ